MRPTSFAIGVLLWLATQFFGFGVAGAGHGWVSPFYVSISLLLLYPAAVVRLFSKEQSPAADGSLLLAAATLDLLLLWCSLAEGSQYVVRIWRFDPALVAGWAALWAGWQVLALASLLRRRSHSAEDGALPDQPGPLNEASEQ